MDEAMERLARLEQRVHDINERGSHGVARLEAQVTRDSQRLVDIEARLSTIAPLGSTVLVLSEQVKGLREDLCGMRDEWAEDKKQAHDDKRHWRALAYTIAAMLSCALIGAAVVIVSSHP